ncbi:heavy metal translocating P-type ATPase [Marinobacterium sp. LSUCC0821]|uniref:heavy metal translocating P-type ATPase n=1 Tax=Marinobacterium sp. LSUCC0821 TaxID=2668067 RepID=UPI00145177A2|nr:heavy metal translocating P-type ATPase [Marinobacterium sp. LSUCC0821]QJD71315.1 copper-translocating P-type ATPase [Marinobacterium sp. LSUCC0821]
MTIHQFSLYKVTCAGCVRSIEKALTAAEGIDDYVINFADRSATIDASLDADQVIKVITDAGYGAALIEDETDLVARDQQAAHELATTFKKAWVALIVGSLLMIQMLLGWLPDIVTTVGLINGLVTAAITAFVLYSSAGHIYRGAWTSFKRKDFNMDTLIALGTGAAWIYSTLLLLIVSVAPAVIPEVARHLYYEASVMIIGFILLGQALEAKGRSQTAGALRSLMNLQPKTALRIRGDEEREISVQMLIPGDLIRVRPGETIPADALVESGSSYVDESMLTGESVPILRSVGEKVTGGTRNGDGSLVIKATEVGRQSRLSQILSAVRTAQNAKPELGRLADRIAAVFVPVVIVIALLSAAVWWFVGPDPVWSYSVLALMTVLIVACPCALGLATPMAVMVGVGRAAKMGILIRNGEALQRAQDLTCVVLDKTGTLTQGHPTLIGSQTTSEHSDAVAKALASHSDHPLSKALVSGLSNTVSVEIDGFKAKVGQGVTATSYDSEYSLGSSAWLAECGVAQGMLADKARSLSQQGASLVWLFTDQEAIAVYGFTDPLREDSAAAVARMQQMGLKVILLSGDHQLAADAMGQAAGISDVIAGISPEGKMAVIRDLQLKGEVVAMVGDGINDAPALAQAEVGYAMGGGTDVAIAAADVALMQNSLHSVANAISLSRATVRNIKQNLFGAFFYNVAAIPVAAGVLYPLLGLLLNPMIAGAAMALSSVTVVSNARRLASTKLD